MCEFFVANQNEIVYGVIMYVDEKQLKFEMKEVHSQIHELANDLGGDIRYLHQEILNCVKLLKYSTRDSHFKRYE